ncbi:MAG TPA: hypothetical protein VGF97_13885 [Rhizomicrobium sp.]|jgi:hypothetical protein
MTAFVLLARIRSGTGALGSVLDQSPSMKYLWEVFHEGFADKPPNYFHFMRQLSKEYPDAWMPWQARMRFDKYIEFLSSWSGKRDVLIDIKYNSLHHFNATWVNPDQGPSIFSIFRERNVPIIHLRRRNHLRVYVSNILSNNRRVWHSTKHYMNDEKPIKLNMASCFEFLRAQEWQDAFIARQLKGHQNLLEIEYADIFDLRGKVSSEAARSLAAFCRIPLECIGEPTLVKLAPRTLESIVENFVEVRSELGASSYAWMVDE